MLNDAHRELLQSRGEPVEIWISSDPNLKYPIDHGSWCGITVIERAVIEAAINKRRYDLEVDRLEAQREAESVRPNLPLLEKVVSISGSAYKAGLALEESVDALIAAREKQ